MNWGTKITIVMVLFMAFIVTLVTLMIKPNKLDSLIENDYYERGQAFDLDYNATRNASEDQMIPIVQSENKGLSIVFPRAVDYEIILRSLANSDFDKTFKGETAQTDVIIPAKELKPGSWLLRIQYKVGKEVYLYQNKVRIP